MFHRISLELMPDYIENAVSNINDEIRAESDANKRAKCVSEDLLSTVAFNRPYQRSSEPEE